LSKGCALSGIEIFNLRADTWKVLVSIFAEMVRKRARGA